MTLILTALSNKNYFGNCMVSYSKFYFHQSENKTLISPAMEYLLGRLGNIWVGWRVDGFLECKELKTLNSDVLTRQSYIN